MFKVHITAGEGFSIQITITVWAELLKRDIIFLVTLLMWLYLEYREEQIVLVSSVSKSQVHMEQSILGNDN